MSVFFSSASSSAKWSTITEWSITNSTGLRGLIAWASPPKRLTASRMAAKSTIAGTPVKSWRMTRAGTKDTSWSTWLSVSHFATCSISLLLTNSWSSWRIRFSKRILIQNGSLSSAYLLPIPSKLTALKFLPFTSSCEKDLYVIRSPSFFACSWILCTFQFCQRKKRATCFSSPYFPICTA